MLQSNVIKNETALSIDMIEENERALICMTAKPDCCGTLENRLGEWYYPGGTRRVGVMGMMNETFYRTRGNQQVLLHRRNRSNADTGMFCCKVPDSDDNCGINQTLCVNIIGKIKICCLWQQC